MDSDKNNEEKYSQIMWERLAIALFVCGLVLILFLVYGV